MGPELDRQYYRAAEPRDEVFEEDDDVSDTGALSQFPSAAFQSLSIHQLSQSTDKDAPQAGTLLQALNLNSAGRGIRQSPKSKSKDNHNDSKPVALFQTLNLNSAGRGVHEGFDPKVKNYTDHQERYRVRKRISGRTRLSRPVMKKGSCVIFPSPPIQSNRRDGNPMFLFRTWADEKSTKHRSPIFRVLRSAAGFPQLSHVPVGPFHLSWPSEPTLD